MSKQTLRIGYIIGGALFAALLSIRGDLTDINLRALVAALAGASISFAWWCSKKEDELRKGQQH